MTGRVEYGGTQKFDPAKDISYRWADFSVCFDCPCGEQKIILCEDGDTEKCTCGRIYKLDVTVGCLRVDEP